MLVLTNWNKMPFGHRPQDFGVSSLLNRWLQGDPNAGWE